jgi:Family of unknown function (DUF5990)/Domain of unknown function (DUF5655)
MTGPDAPSLTLTAEEDELIAGQYADRSQLRPVFDAVLAAMPALGPLAVRVSRTYVSVATPRRVFAVIQPTTKTRVDLGLRLEHEHPGGRLLAARDLGSTTVRIPLARPEDVDTEVLGWLRRAYAENAAPPPPKRPARPQAPELGQLTVVIEAENLPGRSSFGGAGGFHNVHIGVWTKSTERQTLAIRDNSWLAAEPVPGDAPSARWRVPVTVRRDADGFDFSGPYVRGARGDRHLYLAWGDARDDGTMRLIKATKLWLSRVDPGLIEQALKSGHQLTVRVSLTNGGREAGWSAGPADPEPG